MDSTWLWNKPFKTKQQYHVVLMGTCWVGLKWGLGRPASWAVHGSVHGWCMGGACMVMVHVFGVWCIQHHTTHAPTHARPSLPVVPDPILTPPKMYPSGLHDTAAEVWSYKQGQWWWLELFTKIAFSTHFSFVCFPSSFNFLWN